MSNKKGLSSLEEKSLNCSNDHPQNEVFKKPIKGNSIFDIEPTSNEGINQRNFPSKANYFGQGRPFGNIKKETKTGNRSPLLNYYANINISTSFPITKRYSFQDFNLNEEKPHNKQFKEEKNNKFNLIHNDNNNSISSCRLNNPSYQNEDSDNGIILNKLKNININDSKEEKNDEQNEKNDGCINNSFQKDNNFQPKQKEENEKETNDKDDLFINDSDDNDSEEENSIQINNSTNNNNSYFLNNNMNINKYITNNSNIQINNNWNDQNINQKTIEFKSNDNNIINNNNNNMNTKINFINNQINNEDEMNKKNLKFIEMFDKGSKSIESIKPFIPNKFRDNFIEINQIINFRDETNIFPVYSNNNSINNYTINNNISNNFNLNNNIIRFDLFGNQNIGKESNNDNNFNNCINNNMGNNITINNDNFLQMMKNNIFSLFPMKLWESLFSQNNKPHLFTQINNNIFDTNNQNLQQENFNNNNIFNSNNNNIIYSNNMFNNQNSNNFINNFYYNGDNYQINKNKKYKRTDEQNFGQLHSICPKDYVTTITVNNKKVRRIDPKIYLNESLEFLAYNILPLSKDQAGCRFLQEKLDKEPQKTIDLFFNAMLPHILSIIKDSFGNYLVQKLCGKINQEQLIKILEKISPTILDIGVNNHGTRVIQHIINYLTTKESLDYLVKNIEPYVIPLLKELNGTHIIQQLLIKHPSSSKIINKIIIDNCTSLASHSHGCCVVQKFLNGNDKELKEGLIENLINNCLILIIDQFGNYAIQSILLLNEMKYSNIIAMKIYDNVAYYSKHRHSSNVVEKCFDFCDKSVVKKLIEKLSPPEIVADLIINEHGNYVLQKALACSEVEDHEYFFNIIIPLIPKIKNVSFGDKLLSKLMIAYPQLKQKIKNGNGHFTSCHKKSNSYNKNGTNNNNNNNYCYKMNIKKSKNSNLNTNILCFNDSYNNNYFNTINNNRNNSYIDYNKNEEEVNSNNSQGNISNKNRISKIYKGRKDNKNNYYFSNDNNKYNYYQK